ncbi:MAG UNVERIFIED_CONTAM: hypothetical protein LVQ98_04010 [Rickettsiaceae bacterium]
MARRESQKQDIEKSLASCEEKLLKAQHAREEAFSYAQHVRQGYEDKVSGLRTMLDKLKMNLEGKGIDAKEVKDFATPSEAIDLLHHIETFLVSGIRTLRGKKYHKITEYIKFLHDIGISFEKIKCPKSLIGTECEKWFRASQVKTADAEPVDEASQTAAADEMGAAAASAQAAFVGAWHELFGELCGET